MRTAVVSRSIPAAASSSSSSAWRRCTPPEVRLRGVAAHARAVTHGDARGRVAPAATSSMLSRGGFASVCLALRLTEATNGAAVRIAPFSNFERPRRSYQT